VAPRQDGRGFGAAGGERKRKGRRALCVEHRRIRTASQEELDRTCEAATRRDMQGCATGAVTRIRARAEPEEGADGFEVPAFVATAGSGQECLPAADRPV
jgi:hypothetical protein